MIIEPLNKLNQKYYNGTDDPLYFAYVTHNDLKICPEVKIPYYHGLRTNNIIFDYFPLPCWEEF